MRCPFCSREIEDGSVRCVYCDTDLSIYEKDTLDKYEYLKSISNSAYKLRLRRMKLENRLQTILDMYQHNISFDVQNNSLIKDGHSISIADVSTDSIRESDNYEIVKSDKIVNDIAQTGVEEFSTEQTMSQSVSQINNDNQPESQFAKNVYDTSLKQHYDDNKIGYYDDIQPNDSDDDNKDLNTSNDDKNTGNVIYNEDVKFEGENNPVYEIDNKFESKSENGTEKIQSNSPQVNDKFVDLESDNKENSGYATDIKNNDEYLNYDNNGEKKHSIDDVIAETTKFEDDSQSDVIEEKPDKLTRKEKKEKKLLKKLQKKNGTNREYSKAVLKDNEVIKKSKNKPNENRFCGKVAWADALFIAIVTLIYLLAVIMRDKLYDPEVVEGAMYYVVMALAYTDYILYGIFALIILTFLNGVMQIIIAPKKFAFLTFFFTMLICGGVFCYFYFSGLTDSAIQSIFSVVRGFTG